MLAIKGGDGPRTRLVFASEEARSSATPAFGLKIGENG